MAKRLTDTEIWSKEWFLKLTDLQRNLFLYIKDKCDCAGVYEPNYMLLNFIFKTEIKEEDFLVLKQVVKLPNGNFFITDFINFQYLSPEKPYLNPNNNAHRGVIKCLLKNKIEISPYLAPSEPLVSPCPGALDKDKEKDKDNTFLKDRGVGKETSFEEEGGEEILKDLQNWHGEYSNIFLTTERLQSLKQLADSSFIHLDEIMEEFSAKIETGKEPRYDPQLPNAHFERIKAWINFRKKHRQNFENKASPANDLEDFANELESEGLV